MVYKNVSAYFNLYSRNAKTSTALFTRKIISSKRLFCQSFLRCMYGKILPWGKYYFSVKKQYFKIALKVHQNQICLQFYLRFHSPLSTVLTIQNCSKLLTAKLNFAKKLSQMFDMALNTYPLILAFISVAESFCNIGFS